MLLSEGRVSTCWVVELVSYVRSFASHRHSGSQFSEDVGPSLEEGQSDYWGTPISYKLNHLVRGCTTFSEACRESGVTILEESSNTNPIPKESQMPERPAKFVFSMPKSPP